MTVRLVATDLDGTLLRSDGTVSDRTRSVLLAAEASGTTVVFVTGRPLRWAREVFDHVGDHGLAVVSNGALVWDVARDEAREHRGLEREAGLAMCAALRAAVPGTHFAVETLAGIGLEDHFVERYPMPEGARRGTLPEVFTGPALKVLARHEELDPETFWDLGRAAVADRAVVTWSSETSLLEISAPGVTKATTLELLCAHLGVAREEVVAFGDMPNDLDMLRWAGASYAMENAHPSVHRAADHRAPHHDEDGVAAVLEQLLGLGGSTSDKPN